MHNTGIRQVDILDAFGVGLHHGTSSLIACQCLKVMKQAAMKTHGVAVGCFVIYPKAALQAGANDLLLRVPRSFL